MKTLDELATAVGVPLWKVKRQLNGIKQKRKVHWFHRHGWSNDRGRTMISRACIPLWLWLHPDFKDTYFANEQDKHERLKHSKKILDMYPELRTR